MKEISLPNEKKFHFENELNLNERKILEKKYKFNFFKKIPNSFENYQYYQKIFNSIVFKELENELEAKNQLIIKVDHLEFNFSDEKLVNGSKIRYWTLKLPVVSDLINLEVDEKINTKINVSDTVTISWDPVHSESSNLPNNILSFTGVIKKIVENTLFISFKINSKFYFPDSLLGGLKPIPYIVSFGPDDTIVVRKLNAIKEFKKFNENIQDLILGSKKNFDLN